ncbi:MAG: LuxR family transcriptional regulator [Chloroflexi bacterium]|nr:LuxR family transcriptional regulator [Chloroflexota bacterium]
MQEPSLLVTKFTIPPLRTHLLPRTALIERLNQSWQFPLVLLSASAGWGKTTLLSTWASRCTFPLAWLSLDELDNEPTPFWISVLAALRTCLPGVGQTALEMLRSPQPPPLSAILTTLLNELSHQDTPAFLLLDDYHLIDEQAIHDSVQFLLDHLPAHLHLVLSSRVDPPLALARLRARGQLLELRDADLRFEQEETACFLTHTMNLSLPEAEIAELAQRTEGWIAGLQLAALSLLHHPDRVAFVHGFSGSHRYVLDYVQEEILAHLQVPLRDFLLHTCILSRLSASLCQAVTEQPGLLESEALLKQVERANLFLVPLDEERCWYRFHDLFREVLLARLHLTQPELVPLLHQRAARWYEEKDQFREAMVHWLAARDFPSAVRLMEQVARQFWLSGEATTIADWVMQLPDALIHKHAHLALTAALHLLTSNAFRGVKQWHKAYQEAQALMAHVETTLRTTKTNASHEPSPEMRLLEQRLRLLRAWSAALEPLVKGEREQFYVLYQQMQDLEEDEEVAWQMIPLSITFAFHYLFLREGASLVHWLQDALLRVSRSADPFTIILVRRWLAQAYLRAGQLRQAYQDSSAALHQIEQVERHTIQLSYDSMILALVWYQWNRLEEARSTLHSVIYEATAWQHFELLTWSYRTLLQVELAAGDLAAAQQVAQQEAEHLARYAGYVRYQSWIAAGQVHWWLATGKLAEAGEWMTRVVFRQDAWEQHRAEEFLMLIRVYLAQQQYTQAVEMLERFSSHLDQAEDMTITIEFLSLYAVALWQAGRGTQARTVAARLLTLTEPEGHIRVYLDAGEAMKQVLQSLLDAPQDEEHGASTVSCSYVLTLLAAFEQEERRRALRIDGSPIRPQEQEALSQLSSSLSGPASSTPVLMEPLTAQEQRVLRLLAEGASNQQIATQLVIQLVTVKKHMTNLLGKLGAANRTQALVRAREYGLL